MAIGYGNVCVRVLGGWVCVWVGVGIWVVLCSVLPSQSDPTLTVRSRNKLCLCTYVCGKSVCVCLFMCLCMHVCRCVHVCLCMCESNTEQHVRLRDAWRGFAVFVTVTGPVCINIPVRALSCSARSKKDDGE